MLGSKPDIISTAYFANTKILNQAVVEAALMHNKNVKIGKFALGIYGPPPYGIFSDEKTDSSLK